MYTASYEENGCFFSSHFQLRRFGLLLSSCLLAFLMAWLPAEMRAADETEPDRYVVRGVVLDERNQPMIGALVAIVGTHAVAETDHHGKFKLSLRESGKRRLKVSYVGYTPQTIDINVGSGKEISVGLIPSLQEIGEAVVTGARTERPLKDMPVITRVISRAEIDRVNPLDMQGLLQYTLPGIQFRYNSMSQTSTMTYQGMNSKMVVFLIDGERISGESSDHNIDYNRINIDEIERIEVVRGAASTLYDSNAQGGVINIITKKATRPVTLNINTRYAGSNGEKYGISFGMKRDRWDTHTTIGHRHRKTFYARDDRPYTYEKIAEDGTVTYETDSALMVVPLYGYNVWDASQRFTYHFNDRLSAELKAGYYNNVRPQRPGRKNYERYEDLTLSGRVKYLFRSDRLLDFSFIADSYAKRYIYPAIPLTETPYRNRQETARLNYTGTFGTHTLSLGGEIRHEHLKHYMLKDGGSETAYIGSVYVQEDWKVCPFLQLVAGVRADKAQDYAPHLTPKVSLLYRPVQGVTLRTNYSHGYRPPTLKERFQEFNMANIMYILGNPDLRPETSRQLSGSLELEHGRTHFTLSAYHNRYHNYIGYAYKGSDALQYINTDDRKTTGVEISLRHRPVKEMLLMATYNFVNDYNERNGRNVSTIRPHAVTFCASYRRKINKDIVGNVAFNGHWGARFATYYYDSSKKIYEKSTYDGRTHCSLQCSAQMPRRGLTLGFMIDNLFDYRDKATTALVQLPDAGRSFVLTLKIGIAELLDW